MRALVTLLFAATPSLAALPASVERYLRDEMELNQIPGLAVAVVHSGRTVALAAFGRRDLAAGEAMTAETLLELASVSKPLTALAVHGLVRAGALRPEAAVRDYLPEFRIGDGAWSSRIEVRHLLEHTSGLSRRDDFLVPCCGRPEAGNLPLAVERLASARLRREPGRVFHYANSNYVLLAALIERVTGEAFPGYMRQRIFLPLGMERTTLDEDEARRWGKATGYEWRWGRLEAASTPFSGWYGASQVKSSAADLAKFLEAMLGPQSRFLRDALAPARRAGQRRYAWGWFADPSAAWLNGWPVLEHGGDIWSGNTAVLIAPENGLGVAILINAGVRRAQAMARAVALGVLGRPTPPPTRTRWSERADNWAIVLIFASLVIGLGAAVYGRQVVGDLRMAERRLGANPGRWEIGRSVLFALMALYLLLLPATPAMPPLVALPVSLRWALPLLCLSVASLLGVLALAGAAPRTPGARRPEPRAPRPGSWDNAT